MMNTYTVRALTGLDAERVRIAAEKLGEYNRREGLTTATSLDGTWDIEQAAKLAIHLESLLEVIERLTRTEPPVTDADRAVLASPAVHDWDAEAAEREQYADVLAADEAGQRRADRATGLGWPA